MTSVHLDLTFTAFYRHAPEVVWAALTDCEALQTWFLENDFKAHVGQAFSVKGPHIGVVACTVVALDPPRRMEWSWQPPDLPMTTRVIFTLAEVQGGTRLTVEHVGSSPTAHQADITRGWPSRLRHLGRWLDGKACTSGTGIEVGE